MVGDIMHKKICILGCGSWGTAQAVLLSKRQKEIFLWGRPEDGINEIAVERENSRYLPGIKLSDNIYPVDDISEALINSRYIIIAVPAQQIRDVVTKIKDFYESEMIIVNTAKGIEALSFKRLSQVVIEVLSREAEKNYACLSGPSHAEEVALGIPAAITVAATVQETAAGVQDLYMTPEFRVYTNSDLIGVELGGALKNVIALAAGICEGLGFGDNSKAALITRGLHEITRLGVELGGQARTFSGLSGLGDLIATCTSSHSRNRLAGELLGKGLSVDDALKQVGMVVEGVFTCPVAYQIAVKRGVDMPITTACHNIIYENKAVNEEFVALMQRAKRDESEGW